MKKSSHSVWYMKLRRASTMLLLSLPITGWSLSPVYLDQTLYFGKDEDALKREHLEILRAVSCATTADGRPIFLYGHASKAERTPRQLAQRRAEAVKTALIQFGSEDARIHIKSSGADLPVAVEPDADGRAKNRRVEIASLGSFNINSCDKVVRDRPRP
ncbi:OmpA family protein [Variovorax sp. GB1R11]|uniref:OmpA family protein n=1 Tax=Variovorax sp. GB1R11 TaxID=3443741 RepID=UPI003F48670A